MSLSPADRRLLESFVTNLDDDIYCLHGLPPEVLAVLFAYVSHSPASFRDNLLKLVKSGDLAMWEQPGRPPDFSAAADQARKFHQRWVVGYGHASVAEHADLKFALENVSIIASKVIEDNRLSSYTEKSTRYQVFDRDRFYFGEDLRDSPAAQEYRRLIDLLHDRYQELLRLATGHVEKRWPRPADSSPQAYQNACKAKACDIARYLLPAATLTAIGVSMNARAAAHAISKLLAHPLPECRRIGGRMLAEGTKICPTLLAHAGANGYLTNTPATLKRQAAALRLDQPAAGGERVRLIDFDPAGETRVLAAMLYGGALADYQEVQARVERLRPEEREAIAAAFFDQLDAHDAPLRALEQASLTTELLVDYGAYRDIQRHRLCTQLAQETTTAFGYEMPPEAVELGWEAPFEEAMAEAAAVHDLLARSAPHQAAYAVPLAYRKRVLIKWNLRELHHFIGLRSAAGGHASYRQVAQDLFRILEKCYPQLARFFRVDLSETGLGRLKMEERAAAQRVLAEKGK